MFNYVKNMKASVQDAVARYGMMAGAGAILVVALGFLLGALWVFAAREWGALITNLAFAGGFTLIALIMFAVARARRVEPPTVEDLRDEVQARIAETASNLVSTAEHKVNRFVSQAEYRVSSLAKSAGDQMSQAAGFAPELLQTARDKSFKAGVIPPLLGAFMVGLNIAVRMRRR
ncbi:phage holin family protein [Paracoccus sp. p4-l81]|uniref:phage holin family protein n=1 Tax=unclassified Paracoccus (in: a-proteobacteria) TaxID=2688777 RepID=UPI0035BA6BA3